MSDPATDSRGPLDGVLVADFSRVLAGPYCTMLLADLGAEVIKVEGPSGDDTRHWTPPKRGDVGTYYLAINRNKRSIVLDLADAADLDARAPARHPRGRRHPELQAGRAEAVRPGLRQRPRPQCHAASTARSADSAPREGASLPGYDLLVQAVSGLMSLTGSPDGPAYRAGISVFDVMTGLHSAIGILAALRYRDRTGEGQHVETNLLSSAMSSLVNQTSAYVAGGVVPHRMGNAHLSLFPYEPMPTADGELIVIAGNDAQFRKLCAALEKPELADDDRFATVAARNENRELLRPELEGLLVPPDRRGVVRRTDRGRSGVRARSTPSRAAWSWPSSSASNRSSRSTASPPCATRSGSRRAPSRTATRRPTSTPTRPSIRAWLHDIQEAP